LALRIRSHWNDDEAERSLDEVASALAFIIWQLAKDRAINLHGKDFVYEDDEQRMAVIQEYLIFQLQVIDRLAHIRFQLDEEERRRLIIALAKKLAGHVASNSIDLFGEGNYVAPFLENLSRRGSDYAEFNYTEDGPSYPFLRHFGYLVQQIMGLSQENRWVIDQVMDTDAVEMDRQLSRSLSDLFS